MEGFFIYKGREGCGEGPYGGGLERDGVYDQNVE